MKIQCSPASLYIASILLPPIVFFLMLLGLSIYLEPLEGDLTRLGHWSERDFGWRYPQPSVNVKENGASVTHPEILVLGDSFSRPNIWQSYLAQARQIDVLSFQFKDVNCLSNWVRWVSEKKYFTAKTIIIETAEREFVSRFAKNRECTPITPESTEVAAHTIQPTRDLLGLTKDINYLWEAAKNTSKNALSERIISGEVANVSLNVSTFFSNRKPDRLLYYRGDDLKKNWSNEDIGRALEYLEEIQNSLAKQGLKLMVIIVPDKSSFYAPYISSEKKRSRSPDIFTALKNSRVHSVDLMEYLQQYQQNTLDIYKPNDTHLSPRGFQLMAVRIAQDL